MRLLPLTTFQTFYREKVINVMGCEHEQQGDAQKRYNVSDPKTEPARRSATTKSGGHRA